MSIRLQSSQIFIWRHKWLNARKARSSSSVDGLAMNSFQTTCFKYDTITHAESERWRSTLRRLQEYLTATATKERESAALALTNIHCITQIGFSKTIDTVVQRRPCCLLLTNILTE